MGLFEASLVPSPRGKQGLEGSKLGKLEIGFPKSSDHLKTPGSGGPELGWCIQPRGGPELSELRRWKQLRTPDIAWQGGPKRPLL